MKTIIDWLWKKPWAFINTLFGLNQPIGTLWYALLSFVMLAAFLLSWQFYFPSYIPKFEMIFEELGVLIREKGMLYELGQTLKMVSKGIVISVAISLTISYLGVVMNVFRPIAQIVPRFRWWSFFGFQAIMRVYAADGDTFRLYLLLFAIIPFLVTGFNTALSGVKDDGMYNYAQTLGMPQWMTVLYVIIRGRLAKVIVSIRNNFAILWVVAPAIEVANRDAGGIGAMLFDQARYVAGDNGYASAFAIQLVILACGLLIGLAFKYMVLVLPEERAKLNNR